MPTINATFIADETFHPATVVLGPAQFGPWFIVTMPAFPAPKSAEFSVVSSVGISISPFTFSQQIQDWGGSLLAADIWMPPMSLLEAQPWVAFFVALKGKANVFAFSNPALIALIPPGTLPNGYWRLQENTSKWSVTEGILFGFQLKIVEAKL